MKTVIQNEVKTTSAVPSAPTIPTNELPEIQPTPEIDLSKVDYLKLLAAVEAQQKAQIAPKKARYEAINSEIAKLESEQEKLEHELAALGAPVKSGRGRPAMTPEAKAQAAKDRAEAAALLAAKKAAEAKAMATGALDKSGAVVSNTAGAVNAGV